jgi:hypothetical protein
VKASSKIDVTPEQRATLLATAWWFAECVAEFYKRGTKHKEFRFTIDDMEIRENPDGTVTYLVGEPHTNIDGYVLNVIPQEALDEWDGYQHWCSWRYGLTFDLTSDGMSGDIFIRSGWGASFFFTLTSDGRVKLCCLEFP